MTEATIAPAKRWIELYFDLLPIDGSQYKEVLTSDAHLEEIMIRFVQAHVQKALENASKSQKFSSEGDRGRVYTDVYPLENIK